MTPTALFLISLAKALSTATLYPRGHSARVDARERVLEAMRRALATAGALRISFLDDEVIEGSRVMRELRGWDYGSRLAAIGVHRIEIAAVPSPTGAQFDALFDMLTDRLAGNPGDAPFPFVIGGIRAGPIDILTPVVSKEESAAMVDLIDLLALDEEAGAVRWIHDEVANGRRIPMAEVEAVVHSLAEAMHRDQRVVLPLLELKSVDQYTTTHSCNVSMLSMGLAEKLNLSRKDMRDIGTAALLHDIGKVRVPLDILVKPGKLTDQEMDEMRRHPVEGAKILSARGDSLAAVVAYEHHVWENGQGGYPVFDFKRECHYASRIVHVCDLYDALSTKRPYRDAWPRERTLAMLDKQAGIEVDVEIVRAFNELAHEATETRVSIRAVTENDWNGDMARTARHYEALSKAA